jgi:hypothetical protein
MMRSSIISRTNVASRIARFNDWELNRAEREVKDVADGLYDWRIDRIDRGRVGGISS